MVKDIDGLAALIDACDTVVTISNSNAHIAGALGKEVQLMLPFNAARFWYWQAERKDSLWYPHVHIVRQRSNGDWGPVIEEVCAALPPAQSPAANVVSKKPAPKKAAAPVKKTTAKKRAPAKKPAAAKKKKVAAK